MALQSFSNLASATLTAAWSSTASTSITVSPEDAAKFPTLFDAAHNDGGYFVSIMNATSKVAYTIKVTGLNPTTGVFTVEKVDTIPGNDAVFPAGSVMAQVMSAAMCRELQTAPLVYGDIKLRIGSPASSVVSGWYPCDGTSSPAGVILTRLQAIVGTGTTTVPRIMAPAGCTYYMFLGVAEG